MSDPPAMDRPRFGTSWGAEPPTWRRGPARFDGEWIELDRRGSDLYLPMDMPTLPFDLAGVRSPADAVDFVQRYGLLRQTQGFPDVARERFSEWEVEIALLNGVLRLVKLVRAADRGEQDAVTSLREHVDTERAPRIHGAPAGCSKEDLIKAAGRAVASWLNFGLGGARVWIYSAAEVNTPTGPAGKPSEMFQVIQPPDLIGYAYYQLIRSMLKRVPLANCPEPQCGRVFAIFDPRQRYCSAACANRARQRRFAEKRRKIATNGGV